MPSLRTPHIPSSNAANSRRKASAALSLTLLLLLFASLLVTFAASTAFALQNRATGTVGDVALDFNNAGVTLRLVEGKAATSAAAEITPTIVNAGSVGGSFTYTILPTILAGDDGIGSLSITAPAGYTNLSVTRMQVGGVTLTADCAVSAAGNFCATVSGQTINVRPCSRITTNLTTISIDFTADAPTTPGSGDFTSMLGSGLQPKQATTPGNADANPSNGNTITVQAVPLDLKNATLTANPLIVLSDGIAASRLTATILNSSKLPVAKIPINFSSPRGALDSITQPVAPTDQNGVATGEIRSTTAGVTTVSAAVPNGGIFPETAQVFFTQGQVLELSKSASKKEANVGDVVTYLIQLRNKTTKDVNLVRVEDQIPPNFKYVKGSTRLNGQPATDPVGNRTLTFDIGTIPALADNNGNGRADQGEPGFGSLSYQLVIGSGATPRTYVNTAFAIDVCPTCTISNSDEARVQVTLDPLFDLGTIIGKVFLDKNANGYQDPDEPGVGNAMVALDNGTYALTDEFGRYHFPAVTPGQRLLKINTLSLPAGATVTTKESLVVAVTPALLAKANFGIDYHVDTESIGRPAETGLILASETNRKPLEVIGNVEDPVVIVNGDQAKLQKREIRIVPDNPDHVIEIKMQSLSDPVEFRTELAGDDTVKSWKLTILDQQGREVYSRQGEGALPKVLGWDGRKSDGAMVEGGKNYHYFLALTYADGSSSSTPRRTIGVNVSSAISLNLMGGAFLTGSDKLTDKALPILQETAMMLKRFTQEKILIEGHTDSVDTEAYNLDLSRRRAEAALAYFVEVEKLPRERFIVTWYGESRPVASNLFEEGRELNRRIVIKGEFSDRKEAKVTDQYRGTPEAKINGASVDLDRRGRFATTVDDVQRDNLEVQLTGTQGGTIHTRLPIPRLEILAPQGELIVGPGTKGENCRIVPPAPAGETSTKGVSVACGLRGRTEPGNSVELDGAGLRSSADGTFAAELGLTMGDNIYGLLVRNQAGYSRIANLLVRVADRDREGKLVVTVDPIPNLTLKLPPKGVRLTTPKLTFSGATDPGNSIRVNGQNVPLKANGEFTASVPLTKGMNKLRVTVSDAEGHTGSIEREYEYTDTNIFFLAFADSTFSHLNGKGYLQGAGMDQKSEFRQEGRIAYYLKGMVAGKYLVTSAFDTGTQRLGSIFKDLDKAENDRLLTNLDPDKMYPVYGDSSTIVYDTQSQGKFYLAVESDELHLLLGNYPLNMSDTELAAYQRTLYGGRLAYQSKEKTSYGQPQTKVELFGAELRQAHVRDELAATGTSLYYLSHKDLIEGSEQVSIVIRDKNTGLLLSNQTQQQGIDYSIKYDQGRLLFNRPISSVSQNTMLINQALLAGNPVFIQVDYETRLDSFEKTAMGGHVRKQLGDHLAVGGTYIKDELQSGSYDLTGADTELRLGKSTRLVAEFATSSGNDALTYVSSDGGITYTESATGGDKKGSAWKFAAETDIGEWFGAAGNSFVSGYYKHLGSGFRSNGTMQEQGSTKYGLLGRFKLSDKDRILARFDRVEQDGTTLFSGQRSDITNVNYTHDQGRWQASGEIQSSDGIATNGTAGGRSVYAALRLRTEIIKSLIGTIEHQQTIIGSTNDQSRIGAEFQVNRNLALQASGAVGTLGNAAEAGAIVTLDKSKVYVKERLADDQAGKSTSTVVGGEQPIGPSSKIYTEYQWENAAAGNRTISVLGAQKLWDVRPGLQLLVTGEHGSIASKPANSDRYSLAAGINYGMPDSFKLSSRGEVRWETGSQKLLQYLTTTLLEYKLNPDFTLIGKYRYSVSEDVNLDQVVAMFEERSIGIAYRPTKHDRFNALARYTRLLDQKGFIAQEGMANKTVSDVFSGEWSLQLGKKLEWVDKTAYKVMTESYSDRPSFTGHTLLSLHRLNYHLFTQIDAALEYRLLCQMEAMDQRQGWLSELTWEPIDHLRLGVGFNFTDFSDDEFSDNNYSVYGWFLRVQGKY